MIALIQTLRKFVFLALDMDLSKAFQADILNEWVVLGGHQRKKDTLVLSFPSFTTECENNGQPLYPENEIRTRCFFFVFFFLREKTVTAAESKIRPSSCVLVSRCGYVTGNQMSFCPFAWPVGSVQRWAPKGFPENPTQPSSVFLQIGPVLPSR